MRMKVVSVRNSSFGHLWRQISEHIDKKCHNVLLVLQCSNIKLLAYPCLGLTLLSRHCLGYITKGSFKAGETSRY